MSEGENEFLERAAALQARGDIDGAVATLESALQENPGSIKLNARLARLLETSNRWTRAIDAYSRLLDLLDPESASAQRQVALAHRGECYRQAKCHPQALADYSAAVALQPRTDGQERVPAEYLFALAGRAETLRMMGRPHESLDWFDAALAVHPSHAFAIRGKAAALNALSRFDEAAVLWQQAVEIEPTSEFAQHGLREARLGRSAAVPRPSANQHHLYLWARALVAEGRRSDALDALTTDAAPEDPSALIELAALFEEARAFDRALEVYARVAELAPEDVRAHRGRGEALRKAARFEEALPHYELAIGLDPHDVYSLAGLGECQRMLEHHEQAITWYERALAEHPDHLFALRGLAATWNSLEQYERALPYWDRALALDPESELLQAGRARAEHEVGRESTEMVLAEGPALPAVIGLEATLTNARALLQNGSWEEAAREVMALDGWRDLPAATYLAARAWIEGRDYPRALDAFERTLVLAPDNLGAALGRADCLRRQHDFRAAARAYETILEQVPDDLHALTGRGESARMLGEFDAAVDWFDRALEARRSHFPAVCGKAASLNALARFAEAEPLWLEALAESPKAVFVRRGLLTCQRALGRSDELGLAPVPAAPVQRPPDPKSPARAAVEQGRRHYKKREFTKAIRYFQQAVALDPSYTEAVLRLGMAHEDEAQQNKAGEQRIAEFEEAIRCYERCLDLDPEHYQAATNIGEALRKADRYQEALEAYDRALRIRPRYLYALAGRAECLRMLKQFEASLGWFDQALEEKPNHAFALQGKAAALNALSRWDEALPLWDAALEVEPDSEFAKGGRETCIDGMTTPDEVQSSTPVLDEQGRDLTALAKAGTLGRVVGRDAESRATMKTLIRRLKANPLLLGDPGVGKTAVVEGVAQRLARPDAPERLKGLRIIELSMGSLVAGTKYRGTFEERLKQIVVECKQHPEIVLFIDEIHTLVGAGRTEGGSLDAANILKPALARGEIQVIGASTVEEYRKSIETDSALDRRFQPILVKEPSEEATLGLLREVVSEYESHHGVEVHDDALEACVQLSVRFVPNRRLPDKALDLLDEAAADSSLSKRGFVDASVVAAVLSERTGIPVHDLTLEERTRLLDLERTLAQRVVGQEHAVSQLAKAVRLARSGLRDPHRPRGVFLFAGPSGVGKTELAKSLAEFLFPEGDALIRLDMTEYAERFSASRLVGVPPGYSGHGEEGQLTGPLRKTPYAVVLLDDFEKAHPDVQTQFLALFDEGKITDAEGREVIAREAYFVITSNAGSEHANRGRLGFGNTDAASRREAMLERARTHFRPELLSRIDEMIAFNTLEGDVRTQIAQLHLEKLADRATEAGVTLTWDESICELVAQADSRSGARGILRSIEENVGEPLGLRVVEGLEANATLHATVRDGQVVLSVALPARQIRNAWEEEGAEPQKS